MRYGMNLLLWAGDVNDDLLPVLEQLKKLGFDGVELPVFDLNVDKWTTWAKRLDDLGLARTAVTVRGEEDNPISPDPAVRAKAVQAMERTLDCCQAVGAELLAGPFHSALGLFSGQGPTDDEWKRSVQYMQAVAEHAQRVDVMLSVEYLNRFEAYLLTCAADTVRYINDVDHPNCRMLYDTFHANIEEKDVAEAIRISAPHTNHVHISENDRSTPGAGSVDWQTNFDTLDEVGYDGWLMIEAFGLALPELVAATKIWRRMYQSEKQLARDGLAFMKAEMESRR